MGYYIDETETYPDYVLGRNTEYVKTADGKVETVDHGWSTGAVELSPGELKFYEDMQAMEGYWYWLAIKRKSAAGEMQNRSNPFNRDPEQVAARDEEQFQKAKQKLTGRGIDVPATPDEWRKNR